MRTTVTLDPDVEALLNRLRRERGLSFKEAVNHAIRLALAGSGPRTDEQMPTYAMGFDPRINLDKALALAAAMEDDEILRRLALKK